MELNRDQIIKALECCSGSTCRTDCPLSAIPEIPCDSILNKAALAIIKELTEDNESLNKTISNLLETIKDIKADTLRNMRTQVNNKAVFPDGTREHGYITLKVFDGIVEEMLKNKK